MKSKTAYVEVLKRSTQSSAVKLTETIVQTIMIYIDTKKQMKVVVQLRKPGVVPQSAPILPDRPR